jgi:hypothetical protein
MAASVHALALLGAEFSPASVLSSLCWCWIVACIHQQDICSLVLSPNVL